MKPLSLNEIKQTEFELLKIFDTFCRENNIRYFLSNGTLLGAVKYKGFIPWDDDVDVLVPREDYDRLIAMFQDSDKVCLMSVEREPRYLYPFAKLCDTTTVKDETSLDNGVTLGLNIDVFPLDAWDDDIKNAKREAREIKANISRLSLAKLRRPNAPGAVKRLAQAVLMVGCKLGGSRKFLKTIVDLANRKDQVESRYLGCKAWCIYGEREIIPAEVFASTVEVEFEGQAFPAPIGYDTYLRSLYGDYEQDPPPEKQKTHHSFTAYRL